LGRSSWWELIRFGLVGGLNTAVDMGVFFVCVRVLAPVVAQVCGYTAGTINSFLWNKFFTFRDREKITFGKVVRFLLVNGVSLGASGLVVFFLPGAGVSLGVTKVLATLLTLGINFVGYRAFVFESSGE